MTNLDCSKLLPHSQPTYDLNRAIQINSNFITLFKEDNASNNNLLHFTAIKISLKFVRRSEIKSLVVKMIIVKNVNKLGSTKYFYCRKRRVCFLLL